MLAVEAGRGVALPPLLDHFVSRSQPPLKACHPSFFLYCYYCCDPSLWSGGCPVASYDSSTYTAARAASACCMLQQLCRCLLQCMACFSKYVPRSISSKILRYVRQPQAAASSTDGVENYKLVVTILVAFGYRDWST